MCYIGAMTIKPVDPDAIGLRELRQHASDIIRRVEAGDSVTVTVSGRPTARIVPVGRGNWRRWEDIAGLFKGDRAAEGWSDERDLLDDAVTDPWAER
jgi:prevent-host-death family protein